MPRYTSKLSCSGVLFCVFSKKHLTNMQFRAAILLSALMPHIRFHDLRQSCATLLFAQGVPMKEIQAWLGHSTIRTTANIYTHLDENSKINSANAIIGILEQKRTLRAFHLRVSVEKMVPLTGLEPVLSNLRQILSLLCLPFHHSGICIPQKRGMEGWRDVLEGCSKFPKFQIQKARISLMLFKLGA